MSRLATFVNGLLQGAIAGIATALFDLVVFVLMLFFLLRDGAALDSTTCGDRLARGAWPRVASPRSMRWSC